LNLLWKPIGKEVRFILFVHPKKGRFILMTWVKDMDPLDAIRIYSLRSKIEVSFKSAIHTIGTFSYHFWMKIMKPLKHNAGDQYLHKESKRYRDMVKKKLEAYHKYIQLGCITQGILIFLAIQFRHQVWRKYSSWMRTMNKENIPSEQVTSIALRNAFIEFLGSNIKDPNQLKLLKEIIDPQRLEGMTISA
jgi:hypothetical protein